MPIVGRSPRECAKRFRDHIAELLSKTIAPRIPLMLYGVERTEGAQFLVWFLQGDKPTTIPIKTRFGPLFFSLTQRVEAQKDGAHYRLRTLAYWYRLQAASGLQDEALLRWEYARVDPRLPGPPRNHLHAPVEIALDGGTLDLNKIHTPTGWVTIEELVRFLIAELRVKPVSSKWAEIVAVSERRFREEFTGAR